MWSEFDESSYQELVKDLNDNGDRRVKFNGIEGNLSQFIEAMELVRSIFKH